MEAQIILLNSNKTELVQAILKKTKSYIKTKEILFREYGLKIALETKEERQRRNF